MLGDNMMICPVTEAGASQMRIYLPEGEWCDYYTGEVEIDGRLYTYEGDTLEELREDFEDIIDSIIAFDELGDEDDEDEEDEEEV